MVEFILCYILWEHHCHLHAPNNLHLFFKDLNVGCDLMPFVTNELVNHERNRNLYLMVMVGKLISH